MENGFHIRPVGPKGPQRRTPLPFRRPAKPVATTKVRMLWQRVVDFCLWLKAQKERLGWRRFSLRILAIFALFAILYVAFLWLTLPSVDERTILAASQSTVITDRNGIELYRVFGEEDRTLVPGDQIAQPIKDAIIAIEDKRFFERGCIDVRALGRAVLSFGRAGGASTITRQLARNALNLRQDNIVSRKLKELILGCQLERRYSREKLLELYLNWIPFGQNAYGVEQASKRFFGKVAEDLTIAESAVLASLPQLPSYFSPYGRHVHTSVTQQVKADVQSGKITSADEIDDDDVSIGLLGTIIGSGSLYIGGRADQVLQNMTDQGYITDEEKKEATQELGKIAFTKLRENIRAPHFVLWAKEQVETLLENSDDRAVLEQGGLTIQTTLDWRLQEAAEQVIAAHKDDLQKRFMANNAALVALDPKTREILAYVGNTDYEDETKEGKIDMAQAPRQPGSSFKPFVYASAFRNGYGPATVLYDVPTKFGDYEPQNFEGSFLGLMSARRALGGSRNIPAVKAYFLGGEEDAILALSDALGMPTPLAKKSALGYGAALAIGAAETPLLEMVQGYSAFADGGRMKQVSGIVKVTDARGSILSLQGTTDLDEKGEDVLDPRIAYEITSILSDVSARPNEYWQQILSVPGTQAAAKTGTSNKCLEREQRAPVPGRDENPNLAPCKKRRPDNVWTIGYTPTLVAGVWVGNATSEALSERADGLTVAAPLWKEFMVKAQKIMKPAVTAFSMPPGLTQAQISLLSGELPTECTPVALRKSDIFLSENAPSKDDPACVKVLVDKLTGLLASDSCPVEAQEERSFLMPYNAAGRLFPQWDAGVLQWAATQSRENAAFFTPSEVEGLAADSGTLMRFLSNSGGVLPLPLIPDAKCDISLTPGRTEKPTLEIISPADGGGANYPFFPPKISYTVGSRLRQIEYAIDGKVVATATSAPWSPVLRVPRTIDKSGPHTLRVTLTDAYFNVVFDDVRFTFQEDSSGPSIRMTFPADGTEIEAGAELTMRAESDDPGGVKYVEFFLDNLLLSRDATAPYELTYPSKIDPGSHTLRAVATDLAGNTAEDSVTITAQ